MKMIKIMSVAVCLAFLSNTILPGLALAQDVTLPQPGMMIKLSPNFNPPILKGVKVNTDNPFKFDFVLDKGKSTLSNEQLKDESNKLIKYFLASLTVPEKDLWVNLSPYEKERIIADEFGKTEMGRDLLVEDYMLKQITASLIYPEDNVGKKFWSRIYEEAQKKFGSTKVTMNTFNKVWIVPQSAVVYENANAGTAYVVESTLKVMLEEDYVALSKNNKESATLPQGVSLKKESSTLGNQIVREVIIPQLTKEVNEGANFANLRQVYNSLILATWYKKKIKDSILTEVYADKNKVAGVNINDPQEKQRIYQQYLQAFKKGVYNYIKEDVDPVSNQSIPRKYFSGGMAMKINNEAMITVDKLPNTLRGLMAGTTLLLVAAAVVAPTTANAQGTSVMSVNLNSEVGMPSLTLPSFSGSATLSTITPLPGVGSSGANYTVSGFSGLTFLGPHQDAGQPLVLSGVDTNGKKIYLYSTPSTNGLYSVQILNGEKNIRNVSSPIKQGNGTWVINYGGVQYKGVNATNPDIYPVEYIGPNRMKYVASFITTPMGTDAKLIPLNDSSGRMKNGFQLATINALPGAGSSGSNYTVSGYSGLTFFGAHQDAGKPLVLRGSDSNGQQIYLLTTPSENGKYAVKQLNADKKLSGVSAPVNQGNGTWVINYGGVQYTGKNTSNPDQRPIVFTGSDNSRVIAFYENTPVGTFTTLVPENRSSRQDSGVRMNLSGVFTNGIANFTSTIDVKRDGRVWELNGPGNTKFVGRVSGYAPPVFFGPGGASVMTNNPGLTFTDNGTRAVVPTGSVNISLRHLDVASRESSYTFGAFTQPAGTSRKPNQMFVYDASHNAGYIGNIIPGSVVRGFNGGGLWTVTNVAGGSAAGGVSITLTPFNYPTTTFTFGAQTQVRTYRDKTIWTLANTSLGVDLRGKADINGIPRIIWGPDRQPFKVVKIVGGGATGGASVTVTPIERPKHGDGVGRRDHKRGDGVGRQHDGQRRNDGQVRRDGSRTTGTTTTTMPIVITTGPVNTTPTTNVSPYVARKKPHQFQKIAPWLAGGAVAAAITFHIYTDGTWRFGFDAGTNRAMTVPTGGIDFNADKLNLQLQNAGKEIKFQTNPAMLAQLRNTPGFTSVVIGMMPMTESNFKVFLGV